MNKTIIECDLANNINANEKGNLTFAGYDTIELSKKYGTPLYLVDESLIRSRIRTYKECMEKYYPHGSFPIFASKALSFKRIYEILKEEGIGTDVVSIGEMYTAIKAGLPLDNAFFHGNNKTDEEIKFAINNNIGYFVVDNFEELEYINTYAKEKSIKQKIVIRLTPGIDPHTFKAINTGSVDCKFGCAIETSQAEEITVKALSLSNVELCGFHCHIGSQIFESSPFIQAVDIMTEFMHKMLTKYGFTTKILNLGGGFSVKYILSDPELDIEKCIKEVALRLEQKCAEFNLSLPIIVHEPGRSLVADAGLTLYTVGSKKDIRGFKTYVSVDGGMGDNPRYALYQAQHSATIANKCLEEKVIKCTLAGRCCESGDLIAEDIMLQDAEKGDIAAVFTTGAYNYSMASHYNRVPKPPVVMLTENNDYVAVKRETLDYLLLNDL